MTGLDIALMALASYFAVTMLARMMSQHADASLARLRSDFEAEQQRLAEERRKAERAERKLKAREAKLKYMKELEEKKQRARAA